MPLDDAADRDRLRDVADAPEPATPTTTTAPPMHVELAHERQLRADAERLVGVYQVQRRASLLLVHAARALRHAHARARQRRAEAAAEAADECDRRAAQVKSLEARVRELEAANAKLRERTCPPCDKCEKCAKCECAPCAECRSDRELESRDDNEDNEDNEDDEDDEELAALRAPDTWLASLPPHLRNVEMARWRVPGVLRELNPLSDAQEKMWARGERKAYVTVSTRAQYMVGLYALGVSLTRVDSKYPIAAMLSAELADQHDIRSNLTAAGFNFIRIIDEIFNPAITIGKLSQVHKTGIFTKLRVFELTEFDQVVYLDGDTIVNRNIDSLLELPDDFAVAPEIMGIKNCQHDGFERYIFVEDGIEYCRSHSKEEYHGRTFVYSNSGVMMVKPAKETFDALMDMLREEVKYSDTCIGSPGCNDQRLINMYYADHPYKRLSMLYNVYCDKFLTEQYNDVPYVFHYRGANVGKWGSVSQGMKPWIMQPDSDPREWQDLCHVFLTNHIEFERRWALQQPLRRQAALMQPTELRREWRRLREQQLASYLQQRINNDDAFGQAASLLGLLSSNDTDIRQKASTALVGLGYRSALWLADLGLYQYIELFKRLDLTPDNLFYRIRKPTDLKEIGVGTEYRDAIMNKIRDDHQQLLLDDRFHQRLYTAEKRLEDLIGIVETVRTHYKKDLEGANAAAQNTKKKPSRDLLSSDDKDNKKSLSSQPKQKQKRFEEEAKSNRVVEAIGTEDNDDEIENNDNNNNNKNNNKKYNDKINDNDSESVDKVAKVEEGKSDKSDEKIVEQVVDADSHRGRAAAVAKSVRESGEFGPPLTEKEMSRIDALIGQLSGIKRLRAATAQQELKQAQQELDERIAALDRKPMKNNVELQRIAHSQRTIMERLATERNKLDEMLQNNKQ